MRVRVVGANEVRGVREGGRVEAYRVGWMAADPCVRREMEAPGTTLFGREVEDGGAEGGEGTECVR